MAVVPESRGRNETGNRPRLIRPGALRRREARGALFFLLPSAVVFLVFIAGPIVVNFVLTLFQWDGLSNAQFVGLDNYRALGRDSLLRTVLQNTAIFVVGSVALKMVLGLIFAVAVNQYLGGIIRATFRAIVFFPVIVSGIALSIIWIWLLNTDFGLVNYYLGLAGISPVAWLDSSSSALGSLIIIDTWRSVGFTFVVFTAGLQGIPVHLYEAASLDGANRWSQFRHVTLPLLSPTTFFLLVINMIGAFQFFDLSYAMTHGGPGDATRTMVYYIYDTAFHYFRFGYGSALATVLFFILAVLTFIQVRLSRRLVFYQ